MVYFSCLSHQKQQTMKMKCLKQFSSAPPLYLGIFLLGSAWWSKQWAGWARWAPQRTLSQWTNPEWWCPPDPERKLRTTSTRVIESVSMNIVIQCFVLFFCGRGGGGWVGTIVYRFTHVCLVSERSLVRVQPVTQIPSGLYQEGHLVYVVIPCDKGVL